MGFRLLKKAKMKKICRAVFFQALFLYFSNFTKSRFLLHKRFFFHKMLFRKAPFHNKFRFLEYFEPNIFFRFWGFSSFLGFSWKILKNCGQIHQKLKIYYVNGCCWATFIRWKPFYLELLKKLCSKITASVGPNSLQDHNIKTSFMIFLKNGSTDFFYFGHFGKPKPYRITWYMSQSCTFFLSIDKKNSRSGLYTTSSLC